MTGPAWHSLVPPRPRCPAYNKIHKKCGSDRSVRWARRSVRNQFGTQTLSRIDEVPKNLPSKRKCSLDKAFVGGGGGGGALGFNKELKDLRGHGPPQAPSPDQTLRRPEMRRAHRAVPPSRRRLDRGPGLVRLGTVEPLLCLLSPWKRLSAGVANAHFYVEGSDWCRGWSGMNFVEHHARDALEEGEVPPSRAPSLCPATVSLNPCPPAPPCSQCYISDVVCGAVDCGDL